MAIVDKVQTLTSFHLVQGEYLNIVIDAKKPTGQMFDVTHLTKKMVIYPYGQRDHALLEVEGVQTDDCQVAFKISSIETETWQGKMEYVIELAYSNGDKNMGIGFITMV